jgi:oligopeptide transport system substrate-binding protein
MRKTLAVLLALGLILSVFSVSGCAKKAAEKPGTPAADEPVKGGEMVFGDLSEPAYIDPYNAQESNGIQVVQSVFDSLTKFDPIDTTKLYPAAAESWEPNADATVWTFKLRAGAKFHDGTPVTAGDFVYAWNRIASTKTVNTVTGKPDPSGISYHLSAVKGYDEVQAGTATEMSGVKAIDDTTLEVTMAYPFADFEFVAAHPALAPVPKAAVEGGVDYNGTKVAYGDMPIGNGPFKMAEPWKHNEYVRVARNDDYWGDKALLDTVLFKIFKDTNTEYLEFEAGNLDFSIIGEGQIAQAKAKYGEAPDGYTGEPGKQCILGAQSGVYYANFLTTDPVIKNVDLRRAISLAINRQAISDTVFDGTRTPADNFVPPGIAGYEAGVWVDSKYDVEAAKAALEKAGYPGGKGCPELKLWFNVDGGHQPVWELVQSDLKAIGIPSKLSPTADFATYLKELDAGKVQVGRLGWLSDYPTADNYLYSMFYSKSGDNKSKYNNPAVDKALVEARAITDTAARVAAYQEINKTIQADMPVAPIMFYRHHNVTSDRLHGFTYDAFQYGTFEKAWLTNGGK